MNFSFTVALTKPWSLTLEPNFAVLRNDAGTERPILFEGLNAAAEIAVDVSSEHAKTKVTLDPALQYLITKTVQIDIGAYFGVTKYAPRYNPYIGISARF